MNRKITLGMALPLALGMSIMGGQACAQGVAEYGATAATPQAPSPAPVPAPARSRAAAAPPTTIPPPATAPAPANLAKRNGPVMQGPNCTKGVIRQDKPVDLPIHKSTLLQLPNPVTYRTLGSSDIAQAVLVPPDGLYLLGVSPGTTNMIIQDKSGACHLVDVLVHLDTQALQESMRTLMPEHKNIQVSAAANSIVLSGEVEDAMAVQRAVEIANAYVARTTNFAGGGIVSRLDVSLDAQSAAPRLQGQVINQLTVRAPQQVMLEVKVAEVSKTLLDKLGGSVSINRSWNGGRDTFSLISNFLSNGGGLVQAMRVGSTSLGIDGQKDDGLVRVLAEPNIMAVSGQQASFRSGGKIFIPVSQTSQTLGTPLITLEEKEFGIGVRFMPTVLGGSRINLKLVSEVSELSQTGSPFTSVNGVVSVLPSMTLRRADTTVQLNDGQSFVVAGLIKNNMTETVKRFPGLGETPILGALFRSTEFQNDQTELMFVVTPRLVKPLPEAARLPTDNHVVPSRLEVYGSGALESSRPASGAPAAAGPGQM